MSQSMTQHGSFSWVERRGAGSGAARDFYQRILGWTVRETPMSNGAVYHAIQVGDQPVGGFVESDEPNAWLPYVTVDDVDARVRAVKEAGGRVIAEPSSVAGVGRMATVADPGGATVALIAYESKS